MNDYRLARPQYTRMSLMLSLLIIENFITRRSVLEGEFVLTFRAADHCLLVKAPPPFRAETRGVKQCRRHSAARRAGSGLDYLLFQPSAQ